MASTGINPAGAITGYYSDTNYTPHGFVRDLRGTFVYIDPPSAPGSNGIQALAINSAGKVTGWYDGGFGDIHGFVWDPHGSPNGTFTPFDASSGAIRNQPAGINAAGAIAGFYQQTTDGDSPPLGFLRKSNGAFIPFDPKFVLGPQQLGTSVFPSGINDAGTITGSYFKDNQYHGFVRAPNGKFPFTPFDPPGSTGAFNPPYAINSAGAITGYYVDANSVNHGFLWTPQRNDTEQLWNVLNHEVAHAVEEESPELLAVF